MAEREEKVPYYEQVANKLIEQLQAGTAPWQKPWAPGRSKPGTDHGFGDTNERPPKKAGQARIL